jgi:type II secretory pathway pseudopilin PulG
VKRCFSLLEVLISLLIISLSLPLLIAPFLYASVDQQERVNKMRAEMAAQFALTAFLMELQAGKIPASQIVDNSTLPLKKEWFSEMGGGVEGMISLKKLKPARKNHKEEENQVEFELWEVAFSFTSLSLKKPPYFPFQFIVQRGEIPS